MKIIVLNEDAQRVREAFQDWKQTVPKVPGAILQHYPPPKEMPVTRTNENTAYAVEFTILHPDFAKYLETSNIPFVNA